MTLTLEAGIRMDFRARLQKAAQRGQQARDARRSEAEARAMSEEECRRLHTGFRLPLSEHIERCLRELADRFPGFQIQTVVDESGWGAVVSRDDVGLVDGRRGSFFSRLQMVVSPYSKYHVLELAAKGTVRNKETFSRNHYQRLSDADEESFRELVELWVLDYAELYAAAG
jgi:hypothetical protein